jgi:pimeloyl-ACP methyl ester carboxylesterase
VGHDSGAGVAGWCAVTRPDVFRSVVTMSAPFGGPAAWPAVPPSSPSTTRPAAGSDIHADLAALTPPRKHYQWYYSTREANDDMQHAPQGVHDFLRAYYHHKSADWAGNRPFPLASWTAAAIARMPTYYVMRLDQTMAETVAAEMPAPAAIEANAWLPDADLRVYSGQYGRTGFQGGLNWYRCGTTGLNASEMALFAGRTVDVPSMFVAGAQDWGIHQRPGSMERMAQQATDFRGVHLIEGAGHWVQQEQAPEVARLLLEFLGRP